MFDPEKLHTGHMDQVNSVILSLDFRFMISREEETVKFWDAVRGIEIGVYAPEDFELILGGRLLLIPLQKEFAAIY